MKTIDFSYFIERYNAGEMDQTELNWFEKELTGNDSLRKEIFLRRKADQMLVKHDLISLRNKLTGLEKMRKEKLIETSGKRSTSIRYAAIFTGLVLIGSLLTISVRNQSSATLYNKYYSTYEYPGASRALHSSTDDRFSTALRYFADNDYTNAGLLFNDYLKNNPDNMQATLLYGVSEMENKNFTAAEASFNKIIKARNNLYTDHANWYLALCYIATGDKNKAKEELLAIRKTDNIYRNKANKILKNL